MKAINENGVMSYDNTELKKILSSKKEEKKLYRLCLSDKSSILIEDYNLNKIHECLNKDNFIKVFNHNSKKEELIRSSYVWAVRQSSHSVDEEGIK